VKITPKERKVLGFGLAKALNLAKATCPLPVLAANSPTSLPRCSMPWRRRWDDPGHRGLYVRAEQGQGQDGWIAHEPEHLGFGVVLSLRMLTETTVTRRHCPPKSWPFPRSGGKT